MIHKILHDFLLADTLNRSHNGHLLVTRPDILLINFPAHRGSGRALPVPRLGL